MARRNELKAQIEYCLEHFPDTRDSDTTLTIQLWKKYYPQRVKQGKDGELGIYFKDLYDLPKMYNIKRIRAKIQNEEGKWLPNSWEVAKQRKISAIQWKDYCLSTSTYARI